MYFAEVEGEGHAINLISIPAVNCCFLICLICVINGNNSNFKERKVKKKNVLHEHLPIKRVETKICFIGHLLHRNPKSVPLKRTGRKCFVSLNVFAPNFDWPTGLSAPFLIGQ